jgi:hypothetical protein
MKQIGSLVSIMEAARKTDRDEMKQEIRAGQEHIKETMEMQFGSLAAKLDGWRKQIQVDREASKTIDLQAIPEETESKAEQWEVPKKRDPVKSSGAMKRRHTDRHIAAGRCGDPKELTRGDYGSRRKLAAASRKASRRIAVARCNRKVFRKIQTKEIVNRGRNLPQPAGR